MKITEDVRKYAAEHAIGESVSIEHGMKEKSCGIPTQRSRNLF
jgi:hypothetical protein